MQWCISRFCGPTGPKGLSLSGPFSRILETLKAVDVKTTKWHFDAVPLNTELFYFVGE